MRYVWLAILGVGLVPVAVAGFFANPLVFLVLGPEAWRERVAALRPYRTWVVTGIVVCAIATAVYTTTYA